MHADAIGHHPEPIPPLTFQASTWYLLAMAGSKAHHLWADMLAQLQLSPSQFKVLRALGESGPLGQHQLADLIAVDPRNAVPLIDSLAERGLLAREVDAADRRRRVLTLTARGQKLAADLSSIGLEIEDDFFSPLTAAEQQSLRQMLLSLLRAYG
ncbi:MAG TPA: MarR family transcriptional regulator [Streptosporangiaceae bacterium]|nr:MarR family transcriptional regulator [Streptosporangiaceae bacterium]